MYQHRRRPGGHDIRLLDFILPPRCPILGWTKSVIGKLPFLSLIILISDRLIMPKCVLSDGPRYEFPNKLVRKLST
jgi:hypothetical protein